jgi:hypothetical protein
MLYRLYKFKENEKFTKNQAGTKPRPDTPTFDQDKHDIIVKEIGTLAKVPGEDLRMGLALTPRLLLHSWLLG